MGSEEAAEKKPPNEFRRLIQKTRSKRVHIVVEHVFNVFPVAGRGFTRGCCYVEARRLYQKPLDIKQQMGHRGGIAKTLHQLGTLAEESGDLKEAERLFAESLSTLEALRSPDAATARRSLERVRERLEHQTS